MHGMPDRTRTDRHALPGARPGSPASRLWRADRAGKFAATGNVWLLWASRATVLAKKQTMSTAIPQPAQQVLNEYSALVHAALPGSLEGVYIHRSLALNASPGSNQVSK